jgi:hypothetical protein
MKDLVQIRTINERVPCKGCHYFNKAGKDTNCKAPKGTECWDSKGNNHIFVEAPNDYPHT